MGEDNRAILNWTTFYPGNLNVTIDGFVIKWRIDEATNGLPVYEDVVVDAVSSASAAVRFISHMDDM
jgi:hypothetical protein